jgi:hypothetical protein
VVVLDRICVPSRGQGKDELRRLLNETAMIDLLCPTLFNMIPRKLSDNTSDDWSLWGI